MSHLVVEKLLDAIDHGKHVDKDFLRAEQLGTLKGILSVVMYEHPKIKEDVERMTAYFEKRKTA